MKLTLNNYKHFGMWEDAPNLSKIGFYYCPLNEGGVGISNVSPAKTWVGQKIQFSVIYITLRALHFLGVRKEFKF